MTCDAERRVLGRVIDDGGVGETQRASEACACLAEFVDRFEHDMEQRLVELDEALDVGDTAAVGLIAHSIKGNGGQFGGRYVACSCDRPERNATGGVLSDSQTDLEEAEIDSQDPRHALMQRQVAWEFELLRQSAAVFRAELQTFETALSCARQNLMGDRAAAKMSDLADITAVSRRITLVGAEFAADRHRCRISIFRVQAAEGTSTAAIARDWGLSRQLVSRMLNEHVANGSNAT